MSDLLGKYAPDPADDAALARVRAAVSAELSSKKPVRTWKSEALMMFGASFAQFLLVAVVVLMTGYARSEILPAKLLTVVPLLATAAFSSFAALAPRRRGIRIAAVFSALSAAVLLVSARAGIERLSPTPEWVCTALHISAAILPVVVATLLLRGTAPNPLRAAVAGLSMGTTGAMLGELVCEQGLRHVALYHLGAWVTVVLLCVIASRTMKPTSYAP